MFSDSAEGFVSISDLVPDVILEIRYYSTFNFIGERIDGYEEPVALLTREAAVRLKEAADALAGKGYRLKIYDAYRPQKAVDHFMRWAKDPADIRMKRYFYPDLEKDALIPGQYIARHSGHSRGSAVDLTLFDMRTQRDADLGSPFDFFGEVSHPDCRTISPGQSGLRRLLRDTMTGHGFRPLASEWWHFTLENEPWPDTYFTFPVCLDSIRK